MKRLDTERLILRRPERGDAAFFVELLNAPGWLEHIGDRGVRSEEDAVAYVEDVLLRAFEEHGFGLLVVEERGGAAVGLCGLVRRETLPQPDLGFALLPRFEGRGLAAEASEAVLAWCRAQGLQTVLAITSPANERSKRLLERLGFHLQESTEQDGSALEVYGWTA